MKNIFQSVMSLIVLTLSACQQSGPAALTKADITAIEATSKAYLKAVLDGDWDAVAATYTEDAMIMPPNSPVVKGRANIKKYFEGFPPISEISAENVEVVGQEDIAYVRGTYKVAIAVEGAEPVTDFGKFVDILRKQPDGTWLFHRDISNSDLAAN